MWGLVGAIAFCVIILVCAILMSHGMHHTEVICVMRASEHCQPR